MKILEKTKDKRLLFLYIFIVSQFVFFIIWFIDILINGQKSVQWGIFWDGLNDFLADYSNSICVVSGRDPYGGDSFFTLFDRIYPPMAYLIYYPISRFFDIAEYEDGNYKFIIFEPKVLIVVLIGLFIIGVIYYELIKKKLNFSDLSCFLFAFSIFLSFPVFFTIERGNVILYVIPFVMFYLFGYKSENKYIRELSYISLAFAASMKMSPALFGLLLLYEKRWRDALRTIIYGMILFFVPFLFFKGGFENLFILFHNIRFHMEYYRVAYKGCSLFGLLRYFGMPYSEITASVISIISRVLCGLFLIFSYFTKRNSTKVLSLTIILIILPDDSGVYSLLYLIPSMVLFFSEEKDKTDFIALIAYILIMKTYIITVFYGVLWFHTGMIMLVLYLLINCLLYLKSIYLNKIQNSNNKVIIE